LVKKLTSNQQETKAQNDIKIILILYYMNMIVYSISSLLELAEKLSDVPISFPFLESFAGKYSQKVTEDKKVPLFSKTSKYNNFPVRCQWKGGNNERPGQKHDGRRDRSSHDRYQKSGWRTMSNRPSSNPSERMAPTKFKKVSGIKGLAMKVLNKITENNFNAQSNELLNVLLENKEEMSVRIIAELVLEKIWYDKGFYNLYVNLCKKLWDNNDWISECYQIHNTTKGNVDEYFYSLKFESNKSVHKGPFRSKEQAISQAKKVSNFKSVFLSLCRDNFYKRDGFIKEASELPDSTKKYKLKRRLFGTVEILGYFYKMGYLNEDIIHFVFLSLLHTDNIHSSGAKCAEEIEAIKLLWDIVHENINKNTMGEYGGLLQTEMKKSWGSRINFMIEDMIETINTKGQVSGNGFRPRKLQLKTTNNVVSQWETSNKSPATPTTPGSKSSVKSNDAANEKLVKEIIKLSRHYDNENNDDLLDIFKTVDKLSNFNVSAVSNIIKDSTEYGEYAESHVNTIISLLENHNVSSLSFYSLSEAFTIAGEDIPDLKIDAPKAPKNMSYMVGKILNETKEGKIKIDVNKTNIDFGDPVEIEQEWKNILKLTEEFVSPDVLSSRFEILSYIG
jgi:hypothetical protein